MADGAVLAHHVLVLEHDAGAGTIVFRHIWAADKVDDLVGFDGAGARIHRIGSDAGEIIDLERRDGPVALDTDPPLTAMVAGVDVGIKTFDPVGDEFDRPAQQFRQRIGRHFIGINMDLDAEGAADILADHTNLLLLQPQMEGRDVLHHVRRLRALIDRQPLIGGIPVGYHRARLQRHAGMPAKDEIRLHHLVGIGECCVDGTGIEVALEGEIIAERRVNHRCFRIKRSAHVRHRFQFLVFNPHEFGCVLGHRATGCHDGGDGLALPADPIDRDRMLRRRLEALQMREHANPGRDDGRKLRASHNGDDAGQPPRLCCIDSDDFRVRMGRAQEHRMRHARQFHIADVKSPPLHQPLEVRARDHLADVGVRPIELGENFGIGRCHGHGWDPARRRAVVSTASIMAW